MTDNFPILSLFRPSQGNSRGASRRQNVSACPSHSLFHPHCQELFRGYFLTAETRRKGLFPFESQRLRVSARDRLFFHTFASRGRIGPLPRPNPARVKENTAKMPQGNGVFLGRRTGVAMLNRRKELVLSSLWAWGKFTRTRHP